MVGDAVPLGAVQTRLDRLELKRAALRSDILPGPTGESNRLTLFGRGVVLCLGPGRRVALKQAEVARASGCVPLCVAPRVEQVDGIDGVLEPERLTHLQGFTAVIYQGNDTEARAMRRALAARDGALIPLINGDDMGDRLRLERHICIDTTAAGGNANLLAQG